MAGHQVNRAAKPVAGLVVLAVALYLAAGVGMAYVSGFHAVGHRLAHARWWWLAPAAGGVLAAFVGYFLAYRGLNRAEDGPALDPRSLLAVVVGGFGGFFVHGGTAVDQFAVLATGADQREAKVRVTALAGFEHGSLALIVCPASIAAVAIGVSLPRPDFSWPWAVIPPFGFALAVWLAERYRGRLRGRDGWRSKLGIFYDAVHLVYVMLRSPRTYGYAVLGMMLYWGGDMFALWAATTAFGSQMSALQVIVALATGMIFTRRTAPLGGAGVVYVALVPTLWNCSGVPLAAATLGVGAYRALALFAPMPAGYAALGRLRELAERGPRRATQAARQEPALQG